MPRHCCDQAEVERSPFHPFVSGLAGHRVGAFSEIMAICDFEQISRIPAAEIANLRLEQLWRDVVEATQKENERQRHEWKEWQRSGVEILDIPLSLKNDA